MKNAAPNRLLFSLLGAGTLLCLGLGCELIAAVDRDKINDGAGGAAATGGGGSGGTETGVGGSEGGGDACDPMECPGNDLDCRFRVCDADDACAFDNASEGTACDDGDPQDTVCDGEGNCVECNDAGDCPTAGDLCVQNECVPPDCRNGMFDPANGETDVDCGGPNCSPCANDDDCSVATDCVSGVCDSGNTGQCKPCDGSGNFDCQAGDYCDATNVCTALKMQGDACAQADVCSDCSLGDQCPNDFCVDGFCCDTGCANECDSCNVAASEGTCSPSPMGTTCGDPSDTECTNPDSCDGAAVTCQDNHETDGTTCTIGGTMCSGGACI